MTNDITTSEKLSFWELIKNNDKIEIPIIQRDYAQGREDKTRIRTRFLKALKGALTAVPVELDFVYGSKKGTALQPLDGQQRLTTLFLLHWYIATKEEHLDADVITQLQKFTYSTRTSSRDFCKKLILSGIKITHSRSVISDEIKNASWFYSSWRRDPTIKAMLIMLDAIHEFFNGTDGIWPMLTAMNNSRITFNYIGLQDFGLSDDLYIKMNARGKQLSYFENLKADIIKLINTNAWETNLDLIQTFAHNADSAWTDLFWSNGLGEKTFDTAFINFISNSVICSWANRSTKTEVKENKIQSIFSNPENLTTEDIHFEEYENLYKELNLYSSTSYNQLKTTYPCWTLMPKSGQSIFDIIADGKATYPQRAFFYAQTQYLLKLSAFDRLSFDDWLRVIRNILLNVTTDSAASFTGAINLINELSQGCDDIYAYLRKNAVKSNYASVQVKEEILKASILTVENRTVLFEAEDTEFCKGKIDFLLYTVEVPGIALNYDFKKLKAINVIVKEHLCRNDVTNEFRRALLTIDDNEFYTFWDSWTSAIKLSKHSMIKDINDLKKLIGESDYKYYLKSLLVKLTKKTLPVIIEEFLEKNTVNETIPNWKKRLIRDKKLLDTYCQSHCIAVPDHNKFCYLLRIERPRDIDSCKKIK